MIADGFSPGRGPDRGCGQVGAAIGKRGQKSCATAAPGTSSVMTWTFFPATSEASLPGALLLDNRPRGCARRACNRRGYGDSQARGLRPTAESLNGRPTPLPYSLCACRVSI